MTESGVLPAYLLKSLSWLRWIHEVHPEARIRLGNDDLGPWHAMRPSWHPERSGIRLCLRRQPRPLLCWVSSVQPVPWGVRLKVRDVRRKSAEIDVVWDDPQLPESSAWHALPERFHAWMRLQLPRAQLLSMTRATDRVHTLSGTYLRIRLRQGQEEHLVLACPDDAGEDSVTESLTQALLWQFHLRDRHLLRSLPVLHLLVPEGGAAALQHRANLISPEAAKIEICEYGEGPSGHMDFRAPALPPMPQEDRDFRWPVLGPFRWSSRLGGVIDLAPDQIQRYPRFQNYDSLRLLGLEFARAIGPERDRVVYGVGFQQTELTDDTFEGLRSLVGEILYYRRPDSPAPDHPYYRMQAERWLECLVLAEGGRLFPELIPGSVYPQIPVYLGKVPGRVDILGADLQGRLVVMELKVSADSGMPMQSLDYWGRVHSHNLAGDFESRGYFSGIRLSREVPRMYLVAPVFSFHDSLERLLSCLDPRLVVAKIAVNEDWRCGVKILNRSEFACGGAGPAL